MGVRKIELESRKVNIKALESFGIDCFCGNYFVTNKTTANLLYTRRGDSCTGVTMIVPHIHGIYICDTLQDANEVIEKESTRRKRKITSYQYITEKKKKNELRQLNRRKILDSKPPKRGSSKQLELFS